ncbi:MAG: hypothetical protein ACE15B_19875 [Bryobacteraceae bacterium]
MALFTDGTMTSLEDLTAQDSGLLGVVGPEGIDTTKKLILAQEELGVELEALLPRAEAGLAQVVVTPALRLWHVFKTLELVYRDAYHSQLNDRYRGKWETYRDMAKWASERLLDIGIGVAADPVPRAQMPELTAAAGTLEEGTYFACAAWVNGAGEEGAAGPWNSITVSVGGGFVARVSDAPANAAGWNVYAGASAEQMWLQNEAPLAEGTSWTCTELRSGGRGPGTGQAASFTRSAPRILQRG